MRSTYVLQSESGSTLSKANNYFRFSRKMVVFTALASLLTGLLAGYMFTSAMKPSGQQNSSPGNGVASFSKYSAPKCTAEIKSVGIVGSSKNLGTFDALAVRSHLEYEKAAFGISYAYDRKTSFACVDARANYPIIGTPGGDLAEFALALQVYFKSTGISPRIETIREHFDRFVENEIDEYRPFYFHTDETRLKMVYKKLSTIFGRNVTVLPSTTPAAIEKEAWLRELTESYAQGCGHIRLMIASPSDYGLPDSFVIKSVIRVFYEKWWKSSTAEKRLLDFSVKLGPLLGQAVVIINNTGPACVGSSPQITPNLFGSSIFVYHPTAVSTFRETVLTPFFIKSSAGKLTNQVSFFSSLTELFTTQLTRTLAYLPPANATDLLAAQFKTV